MLPYLFAIPNSDEKYTQNQKTMTNTSSPIPIKPISECFIRPKLEQESHKQYPPYYLSHAEVSFSPYHYMQKGLLYNKPSNLNVQVFLDKLKNAISLALDLYYPLAGRFVTVIENDDTCWMYLDPNKGPGASYIYAVCSDVFVDDVVESKIDMIPIIRGFFELGDENVVNYDGHTRALLCVQVTELKDGVFIGITMSHSVVDGTSFWNFVNTLSHIFTSMDSTNQQNMIISHVPIINPIVADGCGPITKLPYAKLNHYITRCKPIVDNNNQHLSEKIFHFSSSSIAKLKAQVNAECKDESLGEISSFQSLVALAWRCITRARRLDSDIVTTCMLLGDARPRFETPLSSNHFGVLIVPIQGSCKVGELLRNSLGWVGMLLKHSIVTLDRKVVHDRSKTLLETWLESKFESSSSIIGGQSAVVVGGSVRFNVYGAEFGLGKAVAIRSGYSSKTDGKITANPGCDGGGSVDLEISLASQAMNALTQDQNFMYFASKSLI